MDNGRTTQLLDPIETPRTAAGGAGRPPITGVKTAAAGASGPRRALLAGVIVLMLSLAGVGAWALLAHERPVTTASAEVEVPDLRGMSVERAGEEVIASNLAPGTVDYAVVEESMATSGTVLSQDPLPGSLVAAGTAMNVIIARGPEAATVAQLVVGDDASAAVGETSSSGTNAESGSGSVPPPPGQQAPLPEMPAVDPGIVSTIEPRITNPGVFNLLKPEYRTVVEHEGYSADAWQSGALTFGDKPKRILIVAEGPQSVPIAVWAWGPSDTDWKLKTIWFSVPGAYFQEENQAGGGTLVETFDVGAGTHTILVRLNPEVTWWKVVIQEQK